MEKSYIYYAGAEITCSICNTKNDVIEAGVSNDFKVHAMMDLKNPGHHDENMLWWAECITCKKSTIPNRMPYLYY